jgi:hypothetical protein
MPESILRPITLSGNICQAELLIEDEIEGGCTQNQVAQTYAFALRSQEPTDWKRANEAILKRWSPAGLKRIKELAWSGKCFDSKPAETL